VKFGPVNPETTRVIFEIFKTTGQKNWAKIGISNLISQQILDRVSPYIQLWYRNVYGDY